MHNWKCWTECATILFCASLAGTLAAQTAVQPDQWHGLVLGTSTAADAERVLGTPASDKPDRLFIERIDKWFIPGLRGRNLRKQCFKEVAGFKTVELYYYNDRLAVIQLTPAERFSPEALENNYRVPFATFADRNPVDYSLVAVTERSVIAAQVLKARWSAKVCRIQIISKELEDHSGADLLR